jgi:hypothetical protein
VVTPCHQRRAPARGRPCACVCAVCGRESQPGEPDGGTAEGEAVESWFRSAAALSPPAVDMRTGARLIIGCGDPFTIHLPTAPTHRGSNTQIHVPKVVLISFK